MEEQTLYRKVHIHGEEDLPKETGFYIANVKDWGISDRHFLVGDKDYFKGWIEDIDWYLLPVTLPSDKEIKQWIKKDRQMKDKILEIMQGVDKANGGKYYENPDKRQKTSSRLIACMVKEFIEWMTCNHVFRATNYSSVLYTIYCDNHKYTLDELFNYWYNNIREK